MLTIIYTILSVFGAIFGIIIILMLLSCRDTAPVCWGILIIGGLIVGIQSYWYYPNKISDALYVNDFESANSILHDMSKNPIQTNECFIFYHHESYYVKEYTRVVSAEINYLSNDKSKESGDMLVSLIAKFPFSKDFYVGNSEDNSLQINIDYNKSANRYNGICNEAFSAALAQKNYDLAERIAELFKDIVVCRKVESNFFSSDIYGYELLDAPKREAFNKLDEVKQGLDSKAGAEPSNEVAEEQSQTEQEPQQNKESESEKSSEDIQPQPFEFLEQQQIEEKEEFTIEDEEQEVS